LEIGHVMVRKAANHKNQPSANRPASVYIKTRRQNWAWIDLGLLSF
jgi:hypothetical protein